MSWILTAAVATQLVLASTSGGLAYERTGSGPGVVLLHCLGGDRTVWSEEAPRLAKSHTVLNVELPGHGQSPPPAQVDFARIARQVTQLIRKEGLAPAVVIGHSIGGTIAAWTPVADPGAVKAVLIVDSSISRLDWPPEEFEALERSLKADYVQGLSSFYSRADSGPEQTARLVTTARRVPRETFVGYLRFAASHSVAKDLQKLPLPVELIASGVYFDGPDHQKALVEGGYSALKTFYAEEVPGTRHWVYWDQPQKYAKLVDGFLARVEKVATDGGAKP